MSEIKNTKELRVMLLEAIKDVREGKMTPREASAIASLSSKVLQSAKLDLDAMRFELAHGDAAKSGEKVLQLVNS